jgi:archaemetzincin
MMKRLVRGAIFLLVGAAIGAAVLYAGGYRYRLPRPANPCSGCPAPSGTPERESDDGHAKLGPAKPGEWRSRFKEAPQGFDDYRACLVNWKCAHRTTFYIQPLGEASARYRETLERMRTYAEAFFGVPAKVLDPLPMVEEARDAKRGQYDADLLVNHLAKNRPEDALVYIGISEKDLFVQGLNYVFGIGDRGSRCGVYSLTRYESGDVPLFTRRSINLLAHEAGHILSINHCVEYSCVMQGANSLEEHDSHPSYLCPVDLQKVLFNTGMDRQDRYRRLQALYEKWDLPKEAAWVAGKRTR